jgi:tripartite-type tricarboxylate transporter receptor subunit TctC
MLATFNKIEGTDIPSMAEAGFPNINVEKLRGLFVPKGTPQPIVDKLVSLMKEAYDDPDFKAFYTANKLVPAFVTGEAFTELLRKQTEQVKKSLEGQK